MTALVGKEKKQELRARRRLDEDKAQDGMDKGRG